MILPLVTSVLWVDFLVILTSKFRSLGHSLDKWYSMFGMVAVISDCSVILLGIFIAMWIVPNASIGTLALVSVGVQLVHDVLFYYGVILPIPKGYNKMIDVFKEYSAENSWKILVADAVMIASTVLGASYVKNTSSTTQWFLLFLGVYALTYVIYTRNSKI
jgi:hypothetical protein